MARCISVGRKCGERGLTISSAPSIQDASWNGAMCFHRARQERLSIQCRAASATGFESPPSELPDRARGAPQYRRLPLKQKHTIYETPYRPIEFIYPARSGWFPFANAGDEFAVSLGQWQKWQDSHDQASR